MAKEIRRGVRQGCVLSRGLFNLNREIFLRDLMELEGQKFGGRNLNNVRCADDTVLFADFEVKLQRTFQALAQQSGGRGLKLNTSRTKVMARKTQGHTSM